MAAGIVAALLHGRPGKVYNIGISQGLTNRQVLDQLAPLAASRGLELCIRVLPARSFDVPANVLQNSKIRAETDWQPQLNFTQALAQTWNWYAEHPHLPH